MNFQLLISGLLGTFLLSAGIALCIIPISMSVKKNPNSKLFVFFTLLTGCFQFYFWGLWATVCVSIIYSFINKPDVTWDWVYWLSGFMWCMSIIARLHSSEQAHIDDLDKKNQSRGACLYTLLLISFFITFSIKPHWSYNTYGWYLNATNYSQYMKRDQININDKPNIEHFFTAYASVIQASSLLHGVSTSPSQEQDFAKAQIQFNNAYKSIAQCDENVLNELYPNWGTQSKENLENALALINTAIKKPINEKMLGEADILILKFDNWLKINWTNILISINHKYPEYPVKRKLKH